MVNELLKSEAGKGWCSFDQRTGISEAMQRGIAEQIENGERLFSYLLVPPYMSEEVPEPTLQYVQIDQMLYELFEIRAEVEDGNLVFPEIETRTGRAMPLKQVVEEFIEKDQLIIFTKTEIAEEAEDEKELIAIEPHLKSALNEIGESREEEVRSRQLVETVQGERVAPYVSEEKIEKLRINSPPSIYTSLGLEMLEECPEPPSNYLWRHQGQALRYIAEALCTRQEQVRLNAVKLPTAAGKTRMQLELAKSWVRTGEIPADFLIVLPGIELIEQTANTFANSGLRLARFYSRKKDSLDINRAHITTYDSLENYLEERLRNNLSPPKFVLFDEAQALLYRKAQLLQNPHFRESILSAWTATPGITRTLEGLGFVTLIDKEITWGIRNKILAPISIYRYVSRVSELSKAIIKKIEENNGVYDQKAVESIVSDKLFLDTVVHIFITKCTLTDESGEIVGLKPTLIALRNITAANYVYESIKAILPPILRNRIVQVTENEGNMQNKRSILAAKKGHVDLIIGIQILEVGIDIPRLENLIVGPRPFTEVALEQLLGRVLRINRDKPSKVATVHEVHFLKNPEEQRIRTVLSILGLKALYSGQIFQGSLQAYYMKGRSRERMFHLTRQLLPVEKSYYIQQFHEFIQIKRRNRELVGINGAPELISKLYSIHEKQRQNGVEFPILAHPALKANDGRISWRVNLQSFEEYFGFDYSLVKSRLNSEARDIIALELANLQADHGLMPHPSCYDHPESFVRALIEFAYKNEITDRDKILSFTRMGYSNTLTPAIKFWSESGLIQNSITQPQQLASFAIFYATLRQLQADGNSVFSRQCETFELVDPRDKFRAIMSSVIEDIALRILERHHTVGTYFIPIDYKSNPELEGVPIKNLVQLAKTLEYSYAVTAESRNDLVHSVHRNQLILKAIEKAKELENINISQNPLSVGPEYALAYLASCMRQQGVCLTDFATAIENLYEISLLSPRSCSSYFLGKLPQDMYWKFEVARRVFPEIALSEKLYNQPTVSGMVSELATYAICNGIDVDNLFSTNFFDHFPPYIASYLSFRDDLSKPRNRGSFRVLMRKYGVGASELIQAIISAVKAEDL